MKIYFSVSRAYRDSYGKNYKDIQKVLEEAGFQITDNGRLGPPSGYFNQLSPADKTGLYRNMAKNIDKADICIFEGSFPCTMHIGHEITLALDKSKPVIVLYTKGKEPVLFRGIPNSKIIWVEYNQENLVVKLAEAIDQAKKLIDVRFNFFVSPKILAYLDFVSSGRRVPRSVFLRNLIEKEMKKDRDFSK